MKAGNIELETVGAIKLIAGAAVNIGTDDYAVTANTLEISALTAKFQGSAICIVKGLFGVQLVGATGLATHPIYASIDIDTAISGIKVILTDAIVTATGGMTVPSPPAPNPPVPIQPTAITAVLSVFAAQIEVLVAAFAANKTIHRASRL